MIRDKLATMGLCALAAIATATLARGEGSHDMWLRNNGVWESVVRVNKEKPYWDLGSFVGYTNGCAQAVVTNWHWQTTCDVTFEVVATGRGWPVGTTITRRYMMLSSDSDYTDTPLPAGGYDDNILQERSRSINTTTNGYTVAHYMHEGVQLPVRMGVPQSIVVDLPYTDLMEVLPPDYPQTRIRVRTGFDGYLLLRYDEQEDRITIKRLLPEKLPYERPPRNLRLSREDLLYGV